LGEPSHILFEIHSFGSFGLSSANKRMGQLKKIIDFIIQEKAKGNSFQELNLQMKLMLKGIPVNQITDSTPDDQEMIQRVYEAAQAFEVDLKKIKQQIICYTKVFIL
jgi:hypothetical protein